MKIKAEDLYELMKKIFEQGYSGDRKEYEKLIEVVKKIYLKKDEDFKIYSLKELRELELDTIIDHSELGEGIIKDIGTKVVFFNDSHISTASFNTNGYPWDRPIRIVKEKEIL